MLGFLLCSVELFEFGVLNISHHIRKFTGLPQKTSQQEGPETTASFDSSGGVESSWEENSSGKSVGSGELGGSSSGKSAGQWTIEVYVSDGTGFEHFSLFGKELEKCGVNVRIIGPGSNYSCD
jgi:hypothetical protein